MPDHAPVASCATVLEAGIDDRAESAFSAAFRYEKEDHLIPLAPRVGHEGLQ